jgi:hypothetical protein
MGHLNVLMLNDKNDDTKKSDLKQFTSGTNYHFLA